MTRFIKKDLPHHHQQQQHQHQCLRVITKKVNRSTVTYALFCFLGLGGLLSCALLGYAIGLLVSFDEESTTNYSSQLFHFSNGRESGATTANEVDESKWMTIPDGWEHFTFTEIRHQFNCLDHAHDQTKLLPSLDEWTYMRKLMKLLVDQRLNLDDPIPPTQGYNHGNTGAPPPYYPQRSDGKGRGLFASRDIKEGELVHDGPHSYIVFPDAMSFRRLIFALPRKSGCDITEWAWHQQLSPTGNLSILVDANIAALMNSSPEPNIAPKTNMDTLFYAVRDISKGEEILQDYSLYETNWTKVGL
jgi:hypothetical protein